MKINIRIKLSGLWTTLMVLYVYCDLYSFHRTDYINEIITGKIGPFDVSQGILAAFGALMIIPILMIPVNLFLKQKATKCANSIVGVLYTLVNLGNLVGETWAYYWMYGLIETAVTVIIVIIAITWKKGEDENA